MNKLSKLVVSIKSGLGSHTYEVGEFNIAEILEYSDMYVMILDNCNSLTYKILKDDVRKVVESIPLNEHTECIEVIKKQMEAMIAVMPVACKNDCGINEKGCSKIDKCLAGISMHMAKNLLAKLIVKDDSNEVKKDKI